MCSQADCPDLSDSSTLDGNPSEEEEEKEETVVRLPWNMRNEKTDSTFSCKQRLVEELPSQSNSHTITNEPAESTRKATVRTTNDSSLLKLEELAHSEQRDSRVTEDECEDITPTAAVGCIKDSLLIEDLSGIQNTIQTSPKEGELVPIECGSEDSRSEAVGIKSLLSEQPSAGNRTQEPDSKFLEGNSVKSQTLGDLNIVNGSQSSPQIMSHGDRLVEEVQTEIKPMEDLLLRAKADFSGAAAESGRKIEEDFAEERKELGKTDMKKIADKLAVGSTVREEVLDYQTIACRIMKNLEDLQSSDIASCLEELIGKTGRASRETQESTSSTDEEDVNCEDNRFDFNRLVFPIYFRSFET